MIHSEDFYEVMDKIDFSFLDSRIKNGKVQFLLDKIEDYDGGNIIVEFESGTDGIVKIDAFTSDYESSVKFITTEDNFDFDDAVSKVNQMIQDILDHKEDSEEKADIEEEKVDYSKKLDFENIYNTKEPEPPSVDKVACKVYYKDGEAILAFDEIANNKGYIQCYVHNGQHVSSDPYYLDECEELSAKDERAKDLIDEYNGILSKDNKELFVLPKGELLDVQKLTHKKIDSMGD